MRTKTSNWFEVKMRYDKVHEDGYEKKVTESYVIEALSFGEAEKTAIEFLGGYVSGEIQVVNINPMKFQEVFFNEQGSCDRYYKAILQFITIDEKTEREKRKAHAGLLSGTGFFFRQLQGHYPNDYGPHHDRLSDCFSIRNQGY